MKPCNTSISTPKDTNKNKDATTEDDIFKSDTLLTDDNEETIHAKAEISSETIGIDDENLVGMNSVL